MYSQYQSFQQQNAAAAVQQQALTWDGSRWVPAESLVQTYTRYYHEWKARQQQYEDLCRTNPSEYNKNQAQWSQYYADVSSQAAHYFHQNPGQTTAPFALPPPPQQAVTATPQPSHPIESAPKEIVKSPQNASQSMKTFVDQCLSKSQNEGDKKEMLQLIQQKMQQAMKEGKFHDPMYWQTQPLLSLPKASTSISRNVESSTVMDHHVSSTITQQQLNDNDSYYGPTSTNTISIGKPVKVASYLTKSAKNKNKNNNSSSNYYGPSSHQFPNDSDFIPVPKKHKKERQGSGFNASSSVLDHRAKRFSGPGGLQDVTTTKSAAGFEKYMGQGMIGGSYKELDESDYEKMTVKGTCRILEKNYLRLTAPPRPELVRPEPILRQHLSNLQAEWQTPKRRDYLWFCSQLKAIRQDCTVQRIQNGFAVDVYETHARIALEEGDLNEFNQSQTQLRYLYEQLKDRDASAVKNMNEFVAYRLLYYVFLTGNEKYSGGSSEMLKILLGLSSEQKSDPVIQNAIRVRSACADVDYHAFFRLRRECSNHGLYLLNHIVPSMRYKGLLRMCKGYRPAVETLFVLKELGFNVKEKESIDNGKEWLVSCGCVLSQDGNEILTKDSVVHESDMAGKTSLI